MTITQSIHPAKKLGPMCVIGNKLCHSVYTDRGCGFTEVLSEPGWAAMLGLDCQTQALRPFRDSRRLFVNSPRFGFPTCQEGLRPPVWTDPNNPRIVFFRLLGSFFSAASWSVWYKITRIKQNLPFFKYDTKKCKASKNQGFKKCLLSPLVFYEKKKTPKLLQFRQSKYENTHRSCLSPYLFMLFLRGERRCFTGPEVCELYGFSILSWRKGFEVKWCRSIWCKQFLQHSTPFNTLLQ